MPPAKLRIGIAGWSVPAEYRETQGTASHLQQYSGSFDCVEINSTFHKPHLYRTFKRWSASVPKEFRFAVKLPKSITHERRLASCDDAVARFCGSVLGLGEKLAVVLVQLPPSLAFDRQAMAPAFEHLGRAVRVRIVCEARHPSWFTPEGRRFLRDSGITEVFADPPIRAGPSPEIPSDQFSYLRLHGQPRIYYSAYDQQYLAALAARLARAATGPGTWCIFDNTALGAAWPNALRVRENLLAILGRQGAPIPP